MFSLRESARQVKILLLITGFIGCRGNETVGPIGPPPAPTLTVEVGANQSATVGTATPLSPSVLVTDKSGAHPAGVSVTFTPDSGAGSVTVPNAKTDVSGIASAGTWTVGTHALAQHLTASVTINGTVLHVTFSASAIPARPSVLKIMSGGAQDGPYGATLVTPVKVLVADQYGNPTVGVGVRFSVDTGGVTAATATSGADGTASTRVRLPRTTGPVVLSAVADSIPAVTTTLTSRGIRFASFRMDVSMTCGLSVEGYPYCWGDNSASQLVPLGVPAGQNASTPQPIYADLDLASITLGNGGGCGVRADGSAVCWGGNGYGANGNGNTSSQVEPLTPVAGGLSFAEIQRGPSATCGTTKTGQSYCWGSGGAGQVGAASVFRSSVASPTPVDGGITFHSYALGSLHSCALDPYRPSILLEDEPAGPAWRRGSERCV
jgi:hypothetical protein